MIHGASESTDCESRPATGLTNVWEPLSAPLKSFCIEVCYLELKPPSLMQIYCIKTDQIPPFTSCVLRESHLRSLRTLPVSPNWVTRDLRAVEGWWDSAPKPRGTGRLLIDCCYDLFKTCPCDSGRMKTIQHNLLFKGLMETNSSWWLLQF